MFSRGGVGGNNGVTRIIGFMDFRKEVKGWVARLEIERRYVILG